jgi:hypothetical protein
VTVVVVTLVIVVIDGSRVLSAAGKWMDGLLLLIEWLSDDPDTLIPGSGVEETMFHVVRVY